MKVRILLLLFFLSQFLLVSKYIRNKILCKILFYIIITYTFFECNITQIKLLHHYIDNNILSNF